MPKRLAQVAAAVAQHRVAEAVLADEPARVAAHVLHVDAEHGGVPAAQALVPALEQRGLRATRIAPRGPEVEHDDLAAVVGERALPTAGQPRQVDLGRRLALAGSERVVDAAVRLVAGEPVREQRHERDHRAQNGYWNGGEQPPHGANRRVEGHRHPLGKTMS